MGTLYLCLACLACLCLCLACLGSLCCCLGCDLNTMSANVLSRNQLGMRWNCSEVYDCQINQWRLPWSEPSCLNIIWFQSGLRIGIAHAMVHELWSLWTELEVLSKNSIIDVFWTMRSSYVYLLALNLLCTMWWLRTSGLLYMGLEESTRMLAACIMLDKSFQGTLLLMQVTLVCFVSKINKNPSRARKGNPEA